MTEYLNESFSVAMGGSEQYRNNWDAIFGNRGEENIEAIMYDASEDPDKGFTSLDTYQFYATEFVKSPGSDQATLEQVMGLCGESGEVSELFKKHYFHGKELDLARVEEELGDVLWYVATLANSCGLSLERLANKNITKLSARYPECAPKSTREDSDTSPMPETFPTLPEESTG